jgi:predicted transcriptional regulator
LNAGFVAESKNRKAVFAEVAAGETDAERIARKHRLIPRATLEALDQLQGAGLVSKTKEGYTLTADGERVRKELRLAGKPT